MYYLAQGMFFHKVGFNVTVSDDQTGDNEVGR